MTPHISLINQANSSLFSSLNIFSLKSIHDEINTLIEVETKDKLSQSHIEETIMWNFPSFNLDKCHFTPAFCPKSQIIQPQDIELLQLNFSLKKNSYSQSNHQSIVSFIPKTQLVPKPQSNYCQVCHQYFHDYIKHINHPIHVKKHIKGKIQPQILNLIEYLRKIQKKSLKRIAPSYFNDNSSCSIKQNEETTSFKASKKIKCQFSYFRKNISDNSSSKCANIPTFILSDKTNITQKSRK